MKPLSRKQKAIVDFIAAFSDDHAYPPTIREIQEGLGISSTSVVDYNLKVLEQRNAIRRNRNISRGIELIDRQPARGNMLRIPVIGQIAAGQPIPVPGDVALEEFPEMVDIGAEMLGTGGDGLFALRVKGHSMIDALIGDGDIVVLRQQQTAENGDTVAVWLRDEGETTLKKFYNEGERIRLQPANSTMAPIYTAAANVDIQGRLITVIRSVD